MVASTLPAVVPLVRVTKAKQPFWPRIRATRKNRAQQSADDGHVGTGDRFAIAGRRRQPLLDEALRRASAEKEMPPLAPPGRA